MPVLCHCKNTTLIYSDVEKACLGYAIVETRLWYRVMWKRHVWLMPL